MLENKRGQFVLVLGEAGLGKSRLTAEFRSGIDPQDIHILEGQSLAYRRTVPYWIIRELLFSYLGLLSSTPVLQVRERLARHIYRVMGSQAAEALPFLEHLLSLPHSDPASAERLSHLDGEQLRQQIFLVVRDLLMLESYNIPLLIILEDLHWADEASLRWFFCHAAPVADYIQITPWMNAARCSGAA
jgi:adenylate cyclase